MDRIAEIRGSKLPTQLGLEVGPYFAPIFPKLEGWNVRTMDVFSTEQLRANAAFDPAIPDGGVRIEEVDYIFEGSLYEAVTLQGKDSAFDYIVSSHNFEHQPNPIRFLADASRLLCDDGVLTMAIPIGTKCFDKLRNLSSTGQLLDAYFNNQAHPTPGQIFDSVLNHATDSSSNVPIHHSNYKSHHLKTPNGAASESWNASFFDYLQNISQSKIYQDAHCWTFNPVSFRLLVEDLRALGILPEMKITRIIEMGLEFIVDLVKQSACDVELLDRASLLKDSLHYFSRDTVRIQPFVVDW